MATSKSQIAKAVNQFIYLPPPTPLVRKKIPSQPLEQPARRAPARENVLQLVHERLAPRPWLIHPPVLLGHAPALLVEPRRQVLRALAVQTVDLRRAPAARPPPASRPQRGRVRLWSVGAARAAGRRDGEGDGLGAGRGPQTICEVVSGWTRRLDCGGQSGRHAPCRSSAGLVPGSGLTFSAARRADFDMLPVKTG